MKFIELFLLIVVFSYAVKAQKYCGKCYDSKIKPIDIQINSDSLERVVVRFEFSFYDSSYAIKKIDFYSIFLIYENKTSYYYPYQIDNSDTLISKMIGIANEEVRLYKCWPYDNDKEAFNPRGFVDIIINVNRDD